MWYVSTRWWEKVSCKVHHILKSWPFGSFLNYSTNTIVHIRNTLRPRQAIVKERNFSVCSTERHTECQLLFAYVIKLSRSICWRVEFLIFFPGRQLDLCTHFKSLIAARSRFRNVLIAVSNINFHYSSLNLQVYDVTEFLNEVSMSWRWFEVEMQSILIGAKSHLRRTYMWRRMWCDERNVVQTKEGSVCGWRWFYMNFVISVFFSALVCCVMTMMMTEKS